MEGNGKPSGWQEMEMEEGITRKQGEGEKGET